MVEASFLIICITMFVGSYLAGCVPLFFTLNERRIRLTSIFGAGLLVGTALSVIIPEGISTMYSSSIPNAVKISHENELKNAENVQKLILEKVGSMNGGVKQNNQFSREKFKEEKPINNNLKRVERNANNNQILPNNIAGGQMAEKKLNEVHSLKENQQNYQQHSTTNEKLPLPNFNGPIGISLTIGFLFMFVVEQYSKSSQTGGRNRSVPTLGLVIHAAADGIAMGSASTSNESEIQFIIFLAIMLHKAPSAFALVSILVLEGLEKARIKQHLLIFSLSAPLSTIITYVFLLNIETRAYSTPYVTGFILLFSAGTFLYIAAAHVLPELVESKCSLLSASGQSSLSGRTHFSAPEVFLFVVSALLPTFLSSHGHGH